jgi:hypothetical protein
MYTETATAELIFLKKRNIFHVQKLHSILENALVFADRSISWIKMRYRVPISSAHALEKAKRAH